MRKHMAWYWQGFAVGGDIRARLALISSIAELQSLLDQIDDEQPYPDAVAYGPRGRTSAAKSVALPDRWLDNHELEPSVDLSAAELNVSGG